MGEAKILLFAKLNSEQQSGENNLYILLAIRASRSK